MLFEVGCQGKLAAYREERPRARKTGGGPTGAPMDAVTAPPSARATATIATTGLSQRHVCFMSMSHPIHQPYPVSLARPAPAALLSVPSETTMSRI